MSTAALCALRWGLLLHMGYNMWSDQPVKKWGNDTDPERTKWVCASDTLRFDEGTWRRVTDRMAERGLNFLVVDLGEAVRWDSHPELAVKGSWSKERFSSELSRLRKSGLEVVPKLNFSAAHDTWLKEYSRMVSTPAYYRVCADVIAEASELFGKPALFHLGFDEEHDQEQYAYSVVRRGDLWWHDLDFLAEQVQKAGSRPWIWSDACWNHPEEFVMRMPKSILQSNWYYHRTFDPQKVKAVKAYIDLENAGFDQLPCGANYANSENFGMTVEFACKYISRLQGFLLAPWKPTVPEFEQNLLDAVELVAREKEK